MGIKKIDYILSYGLAGSWIQFSPVSKRVPFACNGESLVITAQHPAVVVQGTAHGDDLVISGRIVQVTVDEEERLLSPSLLISLRDQRNWV
jgi:hypothetical protein